MSSGVTTAFVIRNAGGPVRVGDPTSRLTVVHVNNSDHDFVMFASLTVVLKVVWIEEPVAEIGGAVDLAHPPPLWSAN